jgi:hypothetical protein
MESNSTTQGEEESFTKGQYYWRFPEVEKDIISVYTHEGKFDVNSAEYAIINKIKPDSKAILYQLVFNPSVLNAIASTTENALNDELKSRKNSHFKLVPLYIGNLNGSFTKITDDDELKEIEQIIPDDQGYKVNILPVYEENKFRIFRSEDGKNFFIPLPDDDRKKYYARINKPILSRVTGFISSNGTSSLVPPQTAGRSTRKKRVKRRKTHKRKNSHKKPRK